MTHSTRTPEEFQHITNLLEIRDLSVDFPHPDGHFQAVKSLSLRIAPGEVLALVGESGSGKSVTAAAILGLLPAGKTQCRGEITFRGIPLLNQPDSVLNQVRGHGIATIFQNSLSVLDPSFTIGSQLTENLRRLAPKPSAKQREQQAVEWLEKVGISAAERVLRSYPHELSGGMRQRVMIALATMCQPALLIADEPTTALDSTIQQQILLLLKQLSQSLNMAVLVITHDFGVVSYLSQRVAVMQHGRIIETNTTEALIRHPQHAYTQTLIGAVPELVLKQRPRSAAQQEVAPVLEAVNIAKHFTLRTGGGWFAKKTRFDAVRPLSLRFKRGEIVGVIGESGSGKSTLARLLARLLTASDGELLYQQQAITHLADTKLTDFRRHLQCVFQDSLASFNPRLTLAEQLTRPLLRLGIATDKAQAQLLARQAMIDVGLDDGLISRYPHQLSGGQRQRASIARALVVKPEFIILDEPTSALDVSVQAQILRLLLDLHARYRLTYLFISHNLPVVTTLCDRIIVMENGQVVDDFASADLYSAQRHKVTQRLIQAHLPLIPVEDPTAEIISPLLVNS